MRGISKERRVLVLYIDFQGCLKNRRKRFECRYPLDLSLSPSPLNQDRPACLRQERFTEVFRVSDPCFVEKMLDELAASIQKLDPAIASRVETLGDKGENSPSAPSLPKANVDTASTSDGRPQETPKTLKNAFDILMKSSAEQPSSKRRKTSAADNAASWNDALCAFADNPDSFPESVLHVDRDCVVISDKYPKVCDSFLS